MIESIVESLEHFQDHRRELPQGILVDDWTDEGITYLDVSPSPLSFEEDREISQIVASSLGLNWDRQTKIPLSRRLYGWL